MKYQDVEDYTIDRVCEWIKENVKTEDDAQYDDVWEDLTQNDVVLGSEYRQSVSEKELKNTAIQPLFDSEFLTDWEETNQYTPEEYRETFFDFLEQGARGIDYDHRFFIVAKMLPIGTYVKDVTGFDCVDR